MQHIKANLALMHAYRTYHHGFLGKANCLVEYRLNCWFCPKHPSCCVHGSVFALVFFVLAPKWDSQDDPLRFSYLLACLLKRVSILLVQVWTLLEPNLTDQTLVSVCDQEQKHKGQKCRF
jgi:hypothetical protein